MGRTIVESAPKDSKGSNGVAERGVQDAEWGYSGDVSGSAS